MKQTIAIIILSLVMGVSVYIGGVKFDELNKKIDGIPEPTVTVEQPVVEHTTEQVTTVMPQGHWEAYCLYPENEQGYRSQGAMIRVSGGNCKSSWRVISLWEK